MPQIVVRVSEEELARLRAVAERERRTVSWVVREAVGVFLGPSEQREKVVRARVPIIHVESGAVVLTPQTCPKCGCSSAMHEAGASQSRCERHPTCRWER